MTTRPRNKILSIFLVLCIAASYLVAGHPGELAPAEAIGSHHSCVDRGTHWDVYGPKWDTGDWLSGLSIGAYVVSYRHLGSTFQHQWHYHPDSCHHPALQVWKYKRSWSRYRVCYGIGFGPVFKDFGCRNLTDYVGRQHIRHYHRNGFS